jgi:hypothetical protein
MLEIFADEDLEAFSAKFSEGYEEEKYLEMSVEG